MIDHMHIHILHHIHMTHHIHRNTIYICIYTHTEMTNDNEMTNVACARRVAVGTLHARRYQLQLHVDGHVLLHHGQLATKQGHHSTNAEGI